MTSLQNPQNQAPAHISWRKSHDGRLTWVSDTYTQLMGVSRAVGRLPEEISAELTENARVIDRACIDSGQAIRLNEARNALWLTWQHKCPHADVLTFGGGAAILILDPTS